MNRYLLYADLDQRLVDGSVVWLLNFARVLSGQMERGRLYVLFKHCRAATTDDAGAQRHLNLLSNSVEDELSKIPNVTTILPTDLACISALDVYRLDHRTLVDAVNEIELCHGQLTRLFVRGFDPCLSLLEAPDYGERVVMYWAYNESFTLMGNSKLEIRDMLRSLPPEDRYDITEKLRQVVNKHNSVVMTDDNDYARYQMMRTYLEDGYYGEGLSWVDNAVSILDLTIVGGILSLGGKSAGGVTRALIGGGDLGVSTALITAAAQRNLTRMFTRTRVQPTSLSQHW